MHSWNDLQKEFINGVLLIGNGASIAVSKEFDYTNLLNRACSSNHIDQRIKELFNEYNMHDFEKILEYLYRNILKNKVQI